MEFYMASNYFQTLCLLIGIVTVTHCQQTGKCNQWPPSCSQHCASHRGAVVVSCSCDDGYQLIDNVHCRATGNKMFLLYTETNRILRRTVDTNETLVIYSATGLIHALAIDVGERRVFWFDSDSKMLMSVPVTGPSVTPTKLITNGLVDVSSMAYDWINNNLYIADVGLHKILSCSLRTGQCATVINSTARAITVDPLIKKLFWSECERSRSIKTSSLNGQNVNVLVRENILCATSLVVDHPMNSLYWTDPRLHTLQVIDIDGKWRRNLPSPNTVNPVDVTVFEDQIYLTHFSADTKHSNIGVLGKFPGFPGSVDRMQWLFGNDEHVVSHLHAFHAALQMPLPDGMDVCRNSRCSDICLPDAYSSYSCSCPEGKSLDLHRRICHDSWSVPSLLVANVNQLLRVVPVAVTNRAYEPLIIIDGYNITALAFDFRSRIVFFAQILSNWKQSSDSSLRPPPSAISRFEIVDPDGLNVIIEDVWHVVSLAVDWISKHLYWIDAVKSVVEMSNLDGSDRTFLIGKNQFRTPNSVTVDPFHGHLYVAECDESRRLFVCDLDGQDCYIKDIEIQLGCVSSLVVDVREQILYWTDSKLSAVSLSNLAQHHSRRIRYSPDPASMTLTTDRIFWTDMHSGNLYFHIRNDEDHGERIQLGVGPLGAIIAIDGYLQPEGENGCSEGNGGCSHTCVALSRMQHYCKCPVSLKLGADRKTCLTQQQLDDPLQPVTVRINQFNNGPKDRTLTTPRPTHDCPSNYCSPSGVCLSTAIGYFCICTGGTTGERCELNGTSVKDDPLHVQQDASRIYPPHLSAPYTVTVTVAVLSVAGVGAVALMILYVVRNHRRLRDGQVYSFKTLLQKKFGGQDDQHRRRLVSVAANDITAEYLCNNSAPIHNNKMDAGSQKIQKP